MASDQTECVKRLLFSLLMVRKRQGNIASLLAELGSRGSEGKQREPSSTETFS